MISWYTYNIFTIRTQEIEVCYYGPKPFALGTAEARNKKSFAPLPSFVEHVSFDINSITLLPR